MKLIHRGSCPGSVYRSKALASTVAAVLLALGASQPAAATQILYEATNLTGNTWRYDYIVINDTLATDLEELTIWFELGLATDLASPLAPTDWDPIAIQPDPLLPDDGFYDALALGPGITPGATLAGFSVQFDFLGGGAPGSQFFEIVDAFDPSITLDSGTTQPIPEPSTALLLLFGMLGLARRQRRRTRPLRMRRGTLALLVAVGVVASDAASAQLAPTTDLSATTMELTGRARRGRVHFAYTYRVTFHNDGSDLTGALGYASSSSTAIRNESNFYLQIGDVAAGASFTIEDALTILVDRRVPFDPSALSWSFLADGTPDLEIVPSGFDFGAPNTGCQVQQSVVLRNVGTGDLVIDDLSCASCSSPFDAIQLSPFLFNLTDVRRANPGNFGFPWTLPSGSELRVPLDYRNTDAQQANTVLRVSTPNLPGRPETEIPAIGGGTVFALAHDEFAQMPTSDPIDIVFTLDRSASMTDDLGAVIETAGTFVEELVSSGIDYRITGIVDDTGCVAGPDVFIDDTFSEAEAVSAFETMVDVGYTLSPYGTNTERGFTLADAALSTPNLDIGGCNEGLIRPEARLALVHISDEPEQSIHPPSYYIDQFAALKGDPGQVVFNAIAGDYPSGCGTAQAGTGYYEATTATGGYFLSICDPSWGDTLSTLAGGLASGLRTSFPLSQPAVRESIVVTVDGALRTSGWSYLRAPYSAVSFTSDGIPGFGSTIEVDYHVLSCE